MATISTAKILVLSDFNAQNLLGYLNGEPNELEIIAESAPFGQVAQILCDFSHPCWQNKYDYLIVWTIPQKLAGFNNFIDFTDASIETLFASIDSFSAMLKKAAEKVKALFLPSWVISSYRRGLGMIELKNELGVAQVLMRANLRLIENLKDVSNIFILNTQRWIELAGARNAHNPKLWYMGKIGFGSEVFKEAASDIRSAINGICGNARKLIVVDLDDTLWGGIVGEVGMDKLNLGGHDPAGESFSDFQKALKALKNRGILLAIASKNDEKTAMNAIAKHPEMVLKPEDFSAWRINWLDKASNISSLVEEMNLGLHSVIFIDDNPVERSRVREALPEVYVPEWPEDKMLYTKSLLELKCFDTPAITEEDQKRTELYAAERKRSASCAENQSVSDWLLSLQTKITAESLNNNNLARATQLLNKTNQMNLTTRRMPEKDFMEWAEKPEHMVWTFRLSDKFGDAGLTGLVSLEISGKSALILDFILSCRIIGRKVEQTILHFITKQACQLNLEELQARFIPTEKNSVCQAFWKNESSFNIVADNLFSFHLNKGTIPRPQSVELIIG